MKVSPSVYSDLVYYAKFPQSSESLCGNPPDGIVQHKYVVKKVLILKRLSFGLILEKSSYSDSQAPTAARTTKELMTSVAPPMRTKESPALAS